MSKRLAPGLRRFGTGAALVLLLAAAGCGKQKAEVSGTVSYRGQPLPGGNVTFFDKDKQVIGSSAITGGKYKIRQLPVGQVIITVTSAPPASKVSVKKGKGGAPASLDAPSPDDVVTIPPDYGSPEKSGLTYQVKPGPQKHNIDLD